MAENGSGGAGTDGACGAGGASRGRKASGAYLYSLAPQPRLGKEAAATEDAQKGVNKVLTTRGKTYGEYLKVRTAQSLSPAAG